MNYLRHYSGLLGLRTLTASYIVICILAPIIGIYVYCFAPGCEQLWIYLQDMMIWKTIGLTMKLAMMATTINILLGIIIAWCLHRYNFFGKSILNSLVDLPLALPSSIAGLMVLMLLGPKSFIGEWAASFGITIVFREPAIVIVMVFVTFPFVIRALQPILQTLDPSIEEAAYLLGASKGLTFRRVIFPMLSPGLWSGAMLAYSRAIAEFGAVIFIAGNLPGKTLLASVYIFGEMESDHPYQAAVGAILLLTLSFLIMGMEMQTQKWRKR